MLTVYGIETEIFTMNKKTLRYKLQQCLPFTVLKPMITDCTIFSFTVATVLTVYGIETMQVYPLFISITVATVLTVYGIETIGIATS